MRSLQPVGFLSGTFQHLCRYSGCTNRGIGVLWGQARKDSLTSQSSIAKDLNSVEEFIVNALRATKSKTIELSNVQRLYIERHGTKLAPAYYGYKKLVDLATSLKSIEVGLKDDGTSYWVRLPGAKEATTPASDGMQNPETTTLKDLKHVESGIIKIIREGPADSIMMSELPRLYQAWHYEQLQPKKYGFKNLSAMIHSFASLGVDAMKDGNTFKVYLSDGKTDTVTVADSLKHHADAVTLIDSMEDIALADAVTFIDSIEDTALALEQRVFWDQDVQAKEVFAVDVEMVEAFADVSDWYTESSVDLVSY